MAEPDVYCVLLARRDDVTREDFLRTWLGEHRRLIGELPGLAGVELLPVADPAPGGPDGVGLLYFASASAMQAALASPTAVRLREHTASFAKSAEATRLLLVTGQRRDAP